MTLYTTSTVTMTSRGPLDPDQPAEVVRALRDRAAKAASATDAGYMLLAADTLEKRLPKTRKRRP